MWVRYISGRPVPVRYTMHKSHVTRGLNYDKYHIDYESYSTYLIDSNWDRYFNIDLGNSVFFAEKYCHRIFLLNKLI